MLTEQVAKIKSSFSNPKFLTFWIAIVIVGLSFSTHKPWLDEADYLSSSILLAGHGQPMESFRGNSQYHD